MSVYYHVANREQILDGIADRVFAEIEVPDKHGDWRDELRRRSHSARRVLLRHPWAVALVQTRLHPGPATLRHHDAVIGTLRQSGFSIGLTAHAFALIDSYVFGFAMSESTLPIHGPETVADTATAMVEAYVSPETHPHLLEFTMEHVIKPGYDFGAEFDFGLELVLDGLERHAAAGRPG